MFADFRWEYFHGKIKLSVIKFALKSILMHSLNYNSTEYLLPTLVVVHVFSYRRENFWHVFSDPCFLANLLDTPSPFFLSDMLQETFRMFEFFVFWTNKVKNLKKILLLDIFALIPHQPVFKMHSDITEQDSACGN